MKYEATPVKNNLKDATKKLRHDEMDKLSTSAILWHVVKRHKFGLVVTYAIVLTAVYIFPPLPEIITSLFQ